MAAGSVLQRQLYCLFHSTNRALWGACPAVLLFTAKHYQRDDYQHGVNGISDAVLISQLMLV